MLILAIRNLLQERGRLLISTAGVASAITLILVMQGIYGGVITQFTRVVDKNPSDVFVAARGIQDFFHGVSLFPVSTIEQLRSEPGIKEVVPASSMRAVIPQGDTKLDLVVFGFEPDKAQGAPWEVVGGDVNLSRDEAIISEGLAEKLTQKTGGSVTVADKTFKIRGLVPEASALGTHYVWVRRDAAAQMLTVPDAVSFGYIILDDPRQTGNFIESLGKKYPNLTVLDKETFQKNNQQTIEESFLPLIKAIVLIALFIGIAVIGLTIYTATVDKSREYGILKAIGVTNRQLYVVVLTQTAVVTVIGTIIGIGLSLGLARILSDVVNVAPEITLQSVGLVSLFTVGMGLIASLLPVKRLTQIDPAEVFKA